MNRLLPSLSQSTALSLTALLLAAFSLAVLSISLADDPKEQPSADKKISPLMHMKLDRSKAILEGLTFEDFAKIESNAQALKLLSTEAGWNVIQTKEYAAQSRDFQRSADLIKEAAKEKNIDRAALGYVALTVRCVECHSYMRKHRIELTKIDKP